MADKTYREVVKRVNDFFSFKVLNEYDYKGQLEKAEELIYYLAGYCTSITNQGIVLNVQIDNLTKDLRDKR